MKQEFQNLVSNAKSSIEQMDYIIAGPQGEGYVKNVINSITIALQHNNALLEFAKRYMSDTSLTTTLQILPIFRQLEEDTMAAQKFIYQYSGILKLLQEKA